MSGEVVVAGARGFVGRALCAALEDAGLTVRRGSRRPGPGEVRLDVEEPGTLDEALAGARQAVYLVHLMDRGRGYPRRERTAASAFAAAAGRAGLERVVYLGGVAPAGPASRHLQARLDSGALLRAGPTPTLELRASMIVGPDSESWKLCRDLALRTPVLVAPPWLHSRSAPVALTDVVAALLAGLRLPLTGSAVYGLPGPEVLRARDVLERIAAARGHHLRLVPGPMPARVAAHGVGLLSGASTRVARELVRGLEHDLLGVAPPFWPLMPGHRLQPFDEAVGQALSAEHRPRRPARALERAVGALARLGGGDDVRDMEPPTR